MGKLRVGLGTAICLLGLAAPGGSQEVAAWTQLPSMTTAAAVRSVLEEVALDVGGAEGQFVAKYRNVRILVHANEHHGRMRIATPVAAAHDLPQGELRMLLEANYSRALDARYAIGDGVVWALFIRPMAGLDRETFLDGADQVVNLKKTFGTSYRSTDLTFGRLP